MRFDPRSKDFLLNANEQFRLMRSLAPIWKEEYDNQIIHHIFGYSEASRVFRDYNIFSSEIDIFDDLLLKDASILIQDDPPRHTEIRNTLMPWVNEMVSRVRHITPEVTSKITSSIRLGELDGVSFGTLIKDEIVKVIFGINDNQVHALNRWGSSFGEGIGIEFLKFEGPEIESQKIFVTNAHRKLDRIVSDIFSNQTPQIESYRSLVINTLGEQHAKSLFKSLIFASNHTISIQITSLLGCIADYSEKYSKLLCSPKGIKEFVNEVLRYKGVFRGSHRKLNQDISTGNVEMCDGDYCIIWNTSANHDEGVFQQGCFFDPSKKSRFRNLTFGLGIHRCVGEGISRFVIEQAAHVLINSSLKFNILSATPYNDPWVDGYAELQLSVCL